MQPIQFINIRVIITTRRVSSHKSQFGRGHRKTNDAWIREQRACIYYELGLQTKSTHETHIMLAPELESCKDRIQIAYTCWMNGEETEHRWADPNQRVHAYMDEFV